MSGAAVEPSTVGAVNSETAEQGLGNEDASFEAGEHGQVTDQGPPPVVRDADIPGIEAHAPQTVSDRAFSHGKEYVCKVCVLGSSNSTTWRCAEEGSGKR
jgi:hypothetical protein